MASAREQAEQRLERLAEERREHTGWVGGFYSRLAEAEAEDVAAHTAQHERAVALDTPMHKRPPLVFPKRAAVEAEQQRRVIELERIDRDAAFAEADRLAAQKHELRAGTAAKLAEENATRIKAQIAQLERELAAEVGKMDTTRRRADELTMRETEERQRGRMIAQDLTMKGHRD